MTSTRETEGEGVRPDACRCDGSGKLRYSGTHRDSEGNEIGHTSGSHPCPCRADLPPREGDAAWWTLEQAFHEFVPMHVDAGAEITVDTEVPYSEDNYKLHRKGNRYYPSLINIEWDQPTFLHREEARALADALNRAADKVAEIDDPDSCPECGIWLPCDDHQATKEANTHA